MLEPERSPTPHGGWVSPIEKCGDPTDAMMMGAAVPEGFIGPTPHGPHFYGTFSQHWCKGYTAPTT